MAKLSMRRGDSDDSANGAGCTVSDWLRRVVRQLPHRRRAAARAPSTPPEGAAASARGGSLRWRGGSGGRSGSCCGVRRRIPRALGAPRAARGSRRPPPLPGPGSRRGDLSCSIRPPGPESGGSPSGDMLLEAMWPAAIRVLHSGPGAAGCVDRAAAVRTPASVRRGSQPQLTRHACGRACQGVQSGQGVPGGQGRLPASGLPVQPLGGRPAAGPPAGPGRIGSMPIRVVGLPHHLPQQRAPGRRVGPAHLALGAQ